MDFLIYLLFTLIFIVVATGVFKVHPFITLFVATIAIGFIGGLDQNELFSALTQGFGNTVGGIGIIIAFGSIIGTFLEKGGGTQAIANVMLRLIGKKRSPLAINLAGLIISIPVYCDSGFVILSSINKALSRKTGISIVVFAVALSSGLYVSHVFVPPTPGPLAAAKELNADLGLVILLGLMLSLPVSLVGLLWGKYIGQKAALNFNLDEVPADDIESPSKISYLSFLPILLPVILIALRSIANYPTMPFGEGGVSAAFMLLGQPIIALFLGMLCVFAMQYKRRKKAFTWTSIALREAGLIILVTAAGGAFGNVLRAAGVGDIIGNMLSSHDIGIFLPFLLAALLKTAQGSSTVAIITTAAILAPLCASLGLTSEIDKALMVLAIGAGAMTVSHVNDSYFWVVAQFSGMDMKTALKSHTIATFLQGATAITILSLIRALY